MSTSDGDFKEDNDEDEVSVKGNSFCNCLKKNMFMITVIIGVLLGFGIGFGIREIGTISDELKTWISMPGDIYIRLLKLTILPLILSNVIIVIAKLDPKENGVISIVSFVYIVVLNVLAATVGTIAAVIIKPGKLDTSGFAVNPLDPYSKSPTTSDVFADLFLNIFPDNIVGIALHQAVTKYKPDFNTTNPVQFERFVDLDDGTNMIGVLFVAFSFGLTANAAKEGGEYFLAFMASIADVVLKLIRAFLLLTPVGVAFMIAGAILMVDDIGGTFARLAMFIVTVVVGIAVMFLLTLLIFVIGTKKNPFKVIPYAFKAWMLSFATTSAIVSVPEMYIGCDDYGVRKGLSRFVCPLVATLKADGSAVFIAAACIYIAQGEGQGSDAGQIVIIWLLTSCLAIAIPHIPSSSIVIIITILTSVGVNPETVSFLYTTEWLLDRIRSGFSSLSTVYCAIFTEHVTQRIDTRKKDKSVDKFDEAMSELTKSFAK